jgi:dimethylamine monooxygenase subunit A
VDTLPEPPHYFPIKNGAYEVTPGLRPLSTDFGNGAADRHVFQFDRRFPRFREGKQAARAERMGKYYLTSDYTPSVAEAVARYVREQLCREHPQWFSVREDHLHCALTGEALPLDAGLDALAMQIQPDLAITCTAPGRPDWLAALHVCSPSAWSPKEKIGHPFVQVHAPVPGMEKIFAHAEGLVRATVERGPFVRFVWGLSGHDRYNQHPEPPPGVSPSQWRPSAFDAQRDPPFWFRVERQVLCPLPEAGASLFLIHPIYTDPRRLTPEEREGLRSALLGMSPESIRYKGVAGYERAIIDWLALPNAQCPAPDA